MRLAALVLGLTFQLTFAELPGVTWSGGLTYVIAPPLIHGRHWELMR
jgi:hypothetical protein